MSIVNEHPELCQGLSIDEYDFAAYQQNLLSAIPGITTFQYDNNADKVVNGGIFALVGGSKHATQKGVKKHNSNVNPKGKHGISDFLIAISKLEPGDYIYENGEFIPITQ